VATLDGDGQNDPADLPKLLTVLQSAIASGDKLLLAPLVVLDEPTADLDPESARHVVEALERLRAGRTILLVAHRPELAELADRVVRLEDGRVRQPEVRAA
jgi:ABC-type lipoprotein export system ATPase subunit